MILHYMVSEQTKNCVDSILRNVKGKKRILVIDNHSPNDSFNILKDYYEDEPNVTVIQNDKNDGYARGHNFGYIYAKENLKLDFICCMNNDMEIRQPDFIKKIYEVYQRTHFSVLGPDIYSVYAEAHQNPERKTMRSYEEVCKRLAHFKKLANHKYRFYIKGFFKNISVMNSIYYSIKKRISTVSGDWRNEVSGAALHGSCLIFSSDYMNKRKEAFFAGTKFYCEAQILDYECSRDGILMVYSPEVNLLHYEDMATNAVFRRYAEKAIFVNDCMVESLESYKRLMERDMQRQMEGIRP